MPAVSWTGCRRRRFHRRAGAPARGRGPAAKRRQQRCGEPTDHGLGRSRGGLSTKIHLAAESRCRPLSLLITAGQAGDAPQFTAVMDAIAVPRRGPGRGPATAPAGAGGQGVLVARDPRLATPTRYPRDHRTTVGPARPPHPARQPRRPSTSVRPDRLSAAQRRRTLHQPAQQWRGLAMRTDKLAVHYQAALTVAGILLWTKT
jgi:hypothetical protein